MEIKQKKRDEIASEFKWNLDALIPGEADWSRRMKEMNTSIETLAAYQGKLTSADALLNFFTAYDKASEEMSKLYVYANMKSHENTAAAAPQTMAAKADRLATQFYAAIAFVNPEIIALDNDAIQRFLSEEPKLVLYRHSLENLLRQKAHVLSTEIETILANMEEVASSAEKIFDMLHDADMRFGQITDADGNTVEITHGRFIPLMESPDRRVRKDAFTTYYDSFGKLKNTLAAALSSSVTKDVFMAQTRRYESSRAAALAADHIPLAVYDNLIAVVHEFLPVLHRYMRLRKQALGVDKLHMYDIYTPIVKVVDAKISYDEAKVKLAESLSALGPDYITAMQAGMNSGWVDVYENEGKQSGAYAWGSYGGHPYVLMNYEGTLGDAFTLAHEMGHAMHSYYTWENQPYVYGGYSIFLAEVASTVNETLMMEHMLANSNDKALRAYLINEYLEQFRGTVFRQTMFAEFE